MTKKRSYSIDIYKFIVSMIILTYHAFIIGIRDRYPFSEGDIFVEFFLYVSGFYTAMHFGIEKNETKLPKCSRISILYTLKKFAKFLPYTIPSTIFSFLTHFLYDLETYGLKSYLARMIDMPTELMLLGSAYGVNDNAPLWQISCMFICFPLYCLILQCIDSYTVIIIAFMAGCVRYGYFDITYRSYFGDFSRVLVGLLIGASLYYAGRSFESKLSDSLKKTVAVCCMMLPIIVAGLEITMPRLVIIMFMLVVLYSNLFTASDGTFSRVAGFLGELSLPIYAWHWDVARLVADMNIENVILRYLLYASVSVVVALINLLIVKWCTMKLKSGKKLA